MKLGARTLAWLLPLLLSACAHNTNQAQMQPLAPPLEDAPPPPDLAPNALPQPDYNLPKTAEPVAVPEPPKPAPRHHKISKPSTTAPVNAAPGPQGTQVAAADTPPAEESATGSFGTKPEAPTFRENSEKMKKPNPPLKPVRTIV